MELAWDELKDEEPDADVATLAAQIGRLHVMKGDPATGSARLETALELAEALWLPEVLAEALDSASVIMTFGSRLEQAQALIKRALELALEHELPAAALRAFNNLGDVLNRRDRCDEAADQLEQGIAYARRVGDRQWEQNLLAELSWSLALTGRWAEAIALLNQFPEERLVELSPVSSLRCPNRSWHRADWMKPAICSLCAPGTKRPPASRSERAIAPPSQWCVVLKGMSAWRSRRPKRRWRCRWAIAPQTRR